MTWPIYQRWGMRLAQGHLILILLGQDIKRKAPFSWYWEVLRSPSTFSREPYQGGRSFFGLFLWSWKLTSTTLGEASSLSHPTRCSWDPSYVFCRPCSIVNQPLMTSALLQSLHAFPTGIRMKYILLIRIYKVLQALALDALPSALLQSPQHTHWTSRTFNFMWFPEHPNLFCFHTSAPAVPSVVISFHLDEI